MSSNKTKFSVGDYVRVVTTPPPEYQGPSFIPAMHRYLGKSYIVTKAHISVTYDYPIYELSNLSHSDNRIKKFWFDERWLRVDMDITLPRELFEL